MTTRKLANLAASVCQRLLNRAREEGRPFQEVATFYAMERFLFGSVDRRTRTDSC